MQEGQAPSPFFRISYFQIFAKVWYNGREIEKIRNLKEGENNRRVAKP